MDVGGFDAGKKAEGGLRSGSRRGVSRWGRLPPSLPMAGEIRISSSSCVLERRVDNLGSDKKEESAVLEIVWSSLQSPG